MEVEARKNGSGFSSSNGVFYSKRKPVEFPSQPLLSLPEFLLFRPEQEWPPCIENRAAYIDASSGRSLLYGQLRGNVRSMALGLSLVLRKGDLLLLLAPSSIHFSSVMLSAMLAGAVVAVANPLSTADEISSVARDFGVAFVAVSSSSAPLIDKVSRLNLPLIIFDEEEVSTALADFGTSVEEDGLFKRGVRDLDGNFIKEKDGLFNSGAGDSDGNFIKEKDGLLKRGTGGDSDGTSIKKNKVLLQRGVGHSDGNVMKDKDGLFERESGDSNGKTISLVALIHLARWAMPPLQFPLCQISQDDAAALLFSSGTTGKSKGVILTHRNLIVRSQTIVEREEEDSTSDPIWLCTIPLFHIYGLTFFAGGLLACRITIVVMPRFDFVEMLKAIQRYRITTAPIVPPILAVLAKSNATDRYDLSSLVRLGCGGAPLSKEVASVFHAKFPKVLLLQGYGLTESSGSGAYAITEEESKNIASVGWLDPSIEAKIVDANSNPLPPNHQGELWLRGPTIMKGYLGNPSATAATVDIEGWLHTGDICFIDHNGFLYIVDRLKELIKYKAFQVAPAELESVLLSHPGISDTAVVPYPDEEAGQIPMAFVVRRPESALTAFDVIKFVAGKVAPHKKVRRVVFTTEIPKSASGKILRRELVARISSKL